MNSTEVIHFASTRGCVLQVLQTEDTPLYWVENAYFVSRPYTRLEELMLLITRLPLVLPIGLPLELPLCG